MNQPERISIGIAALFQLGRLQASIIVTTMSAGFLAWEVLGDYLPSTLFS
jgi:hypothetical protein